MIFLCFLSLLYFLPTIIASHRGLEVTPILLLNLFFGWTGIGWFALLIGVALAQPMHRYWPIAPGHYAGGYWRR